MFFHLLMLSLYAIESFFPLSLLPSLLCCLPSFSFSLPRVLASGFFFWNKVFWDLHDQDNCFSYYKIIIPVKLDSFKTFLHTRNNTIFQGVWYLHILFKTPPIFKFPLKAFVPIYLHCFSISLVLIYRPTLLFYSHNLINCVLFFFLIQLFLIY